jgi:ATP-dependent DNA helicase RecG
VVGECDEGHVAFANTEGGTLHIGVDKKGHIVSAADVSDEHQQRIATKILNILGIVPSISVETREGHPYLAVAIQRVEGRTVLLRGKAFVRSGTVSLDVPQEMSAGFILDRMGQSWDGVPTDMSVEDAIDPAKVSAFIRSAHARDNPRLPEGIREQDPVEMNLEKLNLLRRGRPTNAALLLFGKDPQRLCRHARTRVFFFRDINDFTEYPECTGTVGEQIDAVMRALAFANPARITFPGSPEGDSVAERTKRHESTAYPELALKEAITNAVVHRE